MNCVLARLIAVFQVEEEESGIPEEACAEAERHSGGTRTTRG